jgi:hypothetical protein
MPIYKEDFFERVINVSWETEPKVYWMAGSGYPIITNGGIGDNKAWMFTSEDGIHWDQTNISIHHGPGPYGIGAVYGGGWMREGMTSGGNPVWVFVGADGRGLCASMAAYSNDGLKLSDLQTFSQRHACETFIHTEYQTAPAVMTSSQYNFPNWHADQWFSFNGRTWIPQLSPDHTEIPAQLAVASAAVIPSSGRAAILVDAPEHVVRAFQQSLFEPMSPSLLVPEAPSITPFAQVKPEDIVFIGSDIKATGKVKKGDQSGKKITCKLANWDFNRPAHGDDKVDVLDEKGKKIDTVSCGIQRTECLSYGYYTFVVGGSSGAQKTGPSSQAQKSTIAYSQDGFTWKKIELGPHNQVNALAVGPRPKDK